MKKILEHAFWKTHALLIARVLMGALFVVAGLQKLQGIDGTATFIAGVGLPAPVALAWIAAIIEIVGGAAIILGKYFTEAALALVVFVLVVSFVFHGPSLWSPTDPTPMTMFLKNMAIVAGLLFMAAHGSGATWKLKV